MRDLLLLVISVNFLLPLYAQEEDQAKKEDLYLKTIKARSEKIVSTLEIRDSLKAQRVTVIIMDQYRNLNKVYTERDRIIQLAREKNAGKGLPDSLVKHLEDNYQNKARKFHDPFIAALSRELNEEQVTRVKDGMTYNVLNVTYKALLEMIPSLRSDEKKQIRAWLVEARELAMDAESSDKKHWWFGKYKGRINNYLSAQGYDLQKERKAWEQRLKSSQDQKHPAN